MKPFRITLCLLAVIPQLVSAKTLSLRIEPERDCLLSGSPQEIVLKIDLHAAASKTKHRRTPLNLAVVLDRSGSMTGAKIEKARQAAMQVVEQLGPDDLLSVIIYSEQAEVIIPAQHIEDKDALKVKLSRIRAGGSTALYAGVRLGGQQVQKNFSERRINRVILLSDGLANIGPSSTRELRELGRTLSAQGIAVTTVGVGDDYNEDLMAGLAEASDANYYYVKDTETLPQIFAKELGELQAVAARDVRIEIICPEGVRPIGFLGRPERPTGQRATLYLNQFAAGQNRYAMLRCRVEREDPRLATVKVYYRDELNGGMDEVLEDAASVRYTEDRVVSNNSVRPAVATKKQLLLVAVAKDEALADADAGRFEQAAGKLANQIPELEAQYKTAPPALQSEISQELENLRYQTNEFQQNRYSSSARKSMQSQSWNYRNSKEFK